MKTCSTCRHFAAQQGGAVDLRAASGTCRRYPPQMSHLPTAEGGVQPFAGFPLVMLNWGCGEHGTRLELDAHRTDDVAGAA